MKTFWLTYGKAITGAVVSVIGTGVTFAAARYGHTDWWPTLTGALTVAATATGVYQAPANEAAGTPLPAEQADAGVS